MTTATITLVMPQLGESITEGTVNLWLKKVGDWVDRYEPLVEVMTEKVTVEVPSPTAGYLREILVAEGETVPVGTPLAVLEESSRAAAEQPTPPIPTAPTETPAAHPEPEATESRIRTTPRVRALARELGVDLSRIRGTGPDGRITVEDVERYAAQERGAPAPEAKPAPAEAAVEEALPVTPIRRLIAEHMVRSLQTSPHAWLMVEVDASALVRLRDAHKEEFRRRQGVDLTYLAFVIRAVVDALRQHPLLNSTWAGDKIILKREINIGIAVDTEAGLMVPVIRNADQKRVTDLALAVHELANKARSGKLAVADVQGGTFTVNNTGAFGSVLSMPIIPQPQAAILTMEAIVKRPVVIEGDAIAIRPMMNMCLSFDHRILDGAAAGRFLQTVKHNLETLDPSASLD